MNAINTSHALHATYAPSSGHRWAAEDGCTASAAAIATLGEQEEGEEAAEGTRAHDEIERVLGPLNGAEYAGGDWTALVNDIDDDHPAAHGIALFVAYVKGLPYGTLWIEQRVRLTDQIWGRCDVAHWHAESAVLTIVDYKNGQRAVDVEENEQLRIYAAASILTHGIAPRWVRYVVVQPNDWRPFVPRVKQWHESAESLAKFSERVAAIPKGPLSFRAGDHCRDCPLYGKCEASCDLLADIRPLMAGIVQPANVRPEQVASFLAMQKPIEDAYKAFKKYWEGQALKTSIAPPGMKLVTATRHRAWKDESAAREAVYAAKGLPGLSAPTPAQAEEMGVNIEGLADKPPGGPALAFASDKRKPWVAKSSAEMFAGVPR